MTKEVMTLSEAATFLRLSESKLKTAAAHGEVPARLVVGNWRFSRAALLDWLGGGFKQQDERPWARFAGIFKDDAVFDEVVRNIEVESERQRQEAIREADAHKRRNTRIRDRAKSRAVSIAR